EKLLSIGQYPEVTLLAARAERDAAKALLKEHKDPGATKKLRKAAAVNIDTTFEAMARDWYKRNESEWVKRHADDVIGSLEKEIFPLLGKVQIRDLTAPDILAALRPIEDRGAKDTARRIRQRMSAVF